MMSKNELVNSILNVLLKMPLEQRDAYIAERCGDDAELHAYVSDLAAHFAAADLELDTFEPQFAAVADEAAASFIGTSMRGYTIREHTATGGLGDVFLATSSTSDPRVVAIKIARVSRYAESLARFGEEVRLLRRLKHPHIAQFIDAGETERGSPFLITEFVFGNRLLNYADDHELSLRERLQLFLRLLDAITYAHEEHGIAHRDLHPGNVLVTRTGTPKLLDFGIARIVTDGASGLFTRTTMTLPYASPEQVRMEETSTSTDIFSAGVLLYELLTGHHPFNQSTPALLREDIQFRMPLLPSERVRKTSRVERETTAVELAPEVISRRRRTSEATLVRLLKGDLDAIVLKAINKAPGDRYPTAREFAADLQSHLHQRTVAARPVSRRTAFMLFVRRNRVTSTIAASGLVLLLTALGLLLFRNVSVRRERDRLRAVSTFLEETLQSEDVGEHDVSVRTMLDSARRRIEASLLVDEATHSRLLTTLGTAYQSLGDYATAKQLFQRALTMREHDPLGYAESLNNIATVELQTGHANIAERHLRTAIAMRADAGHQNDAETADYLGNLGLAVKDEGDVSAATAIFTRVMRMPRHDGTAGLRSDTERRNNLAVALYDGGRFAEALPLFRENANAVRRLSGENTARMAMAIKNVASCESDLDQTEAALQHFDEALAIQRRIAGEISPDVALTLNDKALTLANADRDAEAIPVYEECLRIREKVLGPTHPDVGITLNNLAMSFNSTRRFPDAAQAYQRALEITIASRGNDHPDTTMIMANLGKSLMDAGDAHAAAPLILEALRRRRATPSEGQLALESSVLAAAQVERKLSHFTNAEELSREAVQLLTTYGLPQNHWRFANAYLELAGALLGQRRFVEVRQLVHDQAPKYASLASASAEFAALDERARKSLITNTAPRAGITR